MDIRDDKWIVGGIFLAGMATTYLLQKTKVLGAENRVFNAPQNCQGNRSDIHGLTPDGYYTNNPNATSTNYADDYYTITQPWGTGMYRTTFYQFHQDGTKTLRNSVSYNLNMAKGVAHDNRPWKDMTSGPHTTCTDCCIGSGGASGAGASTGTAPACPPCDSCCPSCPACDSCCGQCPECMDCPPPVKCDSCCEPCRNTGGQSTFFGRFFGR
jgi:hypothetical protein